MTQPKNDRRFNRSMNRHAALTNLLNHAKIYGGFDQTAILHKGQIRASSALADQGAAMRQMALVLEKSATDLASISTLPDIETMVAQTSRGDSIACYFFKDSDDTPCTVVALAKTRIPPSADKIFSRTASGYLRITRTVETDRNSQNGAFYKIHP